ncbi:amino acid ABC transporter permease [Lichenibacterium ramalinae]|uniref:Amino acid ABC transporter permease n=1 Tax=Lichenibacterium ramalinae TaxID=2316527 RepID=A0A4Q2RAB5_9HYPH|nr:amino acid ABC transporter permease [Lichenibacterium ramalinae]RYB03973.1 amino acid ABC transporter permease [Lichenibacterium ramalinae]
MDDLITEAWDARDVILGGLLQTLSISALAIVLGTLLGVLVGVALVYGAWPLRLAARAYADVMRGTPVLVLVLAAFYMPAVLGLHLQPFAAGVLALTLFCGAHIGELIRGALGSIPRGQTEAAKAVGLTFFGVLAHVLLPQALRSLLPPWINTCVEMVKASTLLSVIGVGELLLRTQEIIGRNFMTLQFYLLVGALYLVVNFAIEQAGKALERRVAFR